VFFLPENGIIESFSINLLFVTPERYEGPPERTPQLTGVSYNTNQTISNHIKPMFSNIASWIFGSMSFESSYFMHFVGSKHRLDRNLCMELAASLRGVSPKS
jgi:hypothetical protein